MDNQNNAVTAANATQSQTGTAQTRPTGATAAPLLTVFTPTYNRAHLLPRLYESLCKQSYKDFEWIVVDDGSTDNTTEVVQEFIKENKINIWFHKCANGGKHRAINRGVREARGELFFIVDSDDRLPWDALSRIMTHFNQIKDCSAYGGICGLKCYFNGKQTGGNQSFDTIDCSILDIRQKYHIKGDMAEVFLTSVLREFPFPAIEGERFCPEDLVWNRISQKYIFRFFHENIYECEYQLDGLTSRIIRIRMESPIASVIHYSELLSYSISIGQKLKAAINFWRFAPCLPPNAKRPSIKWFWYWCKPLGWVMHKHDLRQTKNGNEKNS